MKDDSSSRASPKTTSPKSVLMNRRVVLKSGGVLALTAAIPLAGCGNGSPSGNRSSNSADNAGGNPVDPNNPPSNPPANPTQSATFFNDKQRETLDAFVDRLIPEDTDPGAVIADCTAFIDAYLAAFLTTPAFIYAGAPFSDRAGHPTNEFLEFVPLDPYEELAWRIVIEGSQGIAEREFNGPVKGLQQIYREGLEQLNERAEQQGADCFAELSAAQRDAIINDTSDATVQELLDVAFLDTLNGMYGPPEYEGNEDLVGWGFTNFDGDTQPTGFTDSQVINADEPGPFDATLPPSYSTQAANSSAKATKPGVAPSDMMTIKTPSQLAALASADGLSFAMANCEGRLSKLKAQLRHLQKVHNSQCLPTTQEVTHA